MLKENEHFEPLGGGIKIIVSDIHHFSTDTILLADFSRPKPGCKAVDLGSGCGTIPLLWLRDNKNLTVDAVEIQPDAADMIKRSAALNSLCDRLNAVNCDLKELKGVLPFGCYDLVACNPPYKLSGSGIVNSDYGKVLARHEQSCTLENIFAAAKNLLQFGGRFCMCQRPERLTDILSLMRKNDLEPKRIRFVQQRVTKPPKLVLVEGRRGGKTGSLVTMPTLFIEDENGDFSQEMKEIYGCYKSEHLKEC